MAGLKIGSLFSGYGGLDMAVESVVGGRTVWVSDVCKVNKDGSVGHYDPCRAPCTILAHNKPEVPNLGDITLIDWSTVEPVDVLTGGFPCQDLSHAGKRAGLKNGTRSGLWSYMCDAIEALRPRLVVAENVRGLLSAEALRPVESCTWCVGDEPVIDMRALGAVLADLAEIGYDASWFSIRASDVGGCHERFRVFLAAYPGGSRLDWWTDLEGKGRQAAVRREAINHLGVGDPSHLSLLKTPTSQLAVNGGSQHPDKRKEGGHGPTLADEVEHLLPTPTTQDGSNNGGPSQFDRNSLPLNTLVTLLPTPVVTDSAGTGNATANRSDPDSKHHAGTTLTDALLPTPTTQNAHGNEVNGRGEMLLPGAVAHLMQPRADAGHAVCVCGHAMGDHSARDGLACMDPGCGNFVSGERCLPRDPVLLPTPAVNDMGKAYTPEEWDEWTAKMKAAHGNGNGHGKSLEIEAARLLPTPLTDPVSHNGHGRNLGTEARLLPTPRTGDGDKGGPNQRGSSGDLMMPSAVLHDFGQYSAAINRWATVMGRPAPPPTEPTGKGGAHRLSPKFTEWMMGLPEGWLTDVPDISRNEALKASGNGVVWQQAATALWVLMSSIAVAA